MTNDNSKEQNKTTSYASVVEYNGDMYVRLDGSDLLTPVDTTSTLHVDDRVTVDITQHNATVTGNISNPSVSGVEIKRTEDQLRIEFEEGLNDLLLVFKDGYYEGITTVNKEGVMVSHTAYSGYTKMSYSGFYLNDGEKDVLSCTKDGLVYTGTITASDILSLDGTFKIDKDGNITGAKVTASDIQSLDGTFKIDKDGNITGAKVTASDIQSLDGAFEIDKDGNITGATFKSSKGGNFNIDEEGEITAAKLSVEDSVSSDTIICNDILNRAYPKTLTDDITLYVSSSGNDNNECVNGATFYTLQGAINSIPKFMNGKSVQIQMNKNCTENITISCFVSGRIYIYMSGYTLYGWVKTWGGDAFIAWRGGSISSPSGFTGTIHPSTGMNWSNKTTTMGYQYCGVIGLYNITIVAGDNHASGLSGNKIGLYAQLGAKIYINNCSFKNCGVGFIATTMAQIYSDLTSGVASQYAFYAFSGGVISLGNSSQAGGNDKTYASAGAGQIWLDNPTFATGSATTTSSSASTTKTTKTATYTASFGQAIQYYGTSSAKWRTDCKPKVGAWGYGPHTAWWFFGGSFSNMSDKDVSKITITFTRNRGGNSAAVTHNFYTHSYTSQPSTASPSYDSTKIGSASAATENSATITITDSTLINKIKSSKGICSIPPSQSNSYYSVMSAVMTVVFTYTE